MWQLWNESDVTRLGGGGARGGAKSGFVRRGIILRRLLYPKTTGLLLRRSHPELYKSHIVKMFEEYPWLAEYWREQPKELAFPNGSKLFFGSAQTSGDIGAFYSAEFADIAIDEAQEFSQGEQESLSGSNRCTSNPNIKPTMISTFMPGVSESGIPPIGLPYLKRVYVDGDIRGNELNRKWGFVQLFSWDNVEWARRELDQDGITDTEFYSWSNDIRRQYFVDRTEYGRNLLAITNQSLRDAWLDGKWDVFQGQYFPNFAQDKHVMGSDAVTAEVKPWFKKWVSLDWGFDHPFCVHWHAQDERGRVITYREYWGRETNETDLGKEIGKRSADEKLVAFPCSWDAGKLSPRALQQVPKSIMQMISDALPPSFPRPFPADSSPGTRPSGARLLSQLLDSNMWHISESCSHLIECLPTLVRDPKNTEDVLKVDYSSNQIGDDPYDCARMGLSYMLGTSRKPWQETVREQAAMIEDPVARALFVHKKSHEKQNEGRAVKPVSMPSWMGRVR